MLQKVFLLLVSVLITTQVNADDSLLRLATTTSTANSGLMDYLLPKFTEETSIEVHLIAVGTGKALRLGREGDVDIVLVHARAAEDDFVSRVAEATVKGLAHGLVDADKRRHDFDVLVRQGLGRLAREQTVRIDGMNRRPGKRKTGRNTKS